MHDLEEKNINDVSFDDRGLVPVIVQDFEDQEVLMLAYMNRDTLTQTLKTGLMTYWSRSRKCVWVKGETSGNYQIVKTVRLDCDADTLLFQVEQRGGCACHTGARTCFFGEIKPHCATSD
ncbi:MAG: phosphoribosyl-AMP cyclohydrolase [Bacteroidetes bacterium]|nr:phosphoribosyl-AMP cyclohydrolase [Bacteroidota bacterium]MCY4232321.1 phosphoribosyl-AMP cyclohydrolase [Bacteroidota bacterium]